MSLSGVSIYRGDTFPLICKISGLESEDISTWTFTLTLNTERRPTDTSKQVFQTISTGAKINNAVTPKEVEFDAPPDTVAPGAYHYDIQAQNAAAQVKTIGIAQFTILQDITK